MEVDKPTPGFTPEATTGGGHGRIWMAALWVSLGVTVISGLFLSVYYVPTFAQAFSSAERLNDQVPFGWLIRRIHAVGGNLLLLIALIHLGRIFIAGDFKGAPRMAWLCGALFLGVSAFTNFTGSFLPLSQEAFWGTTLVLSNISAIPYVGGALADFLRGGKELGASALVRFYSMHVGFAAFLVFLLYWHDRLMVVGEDNLEKRRDHRILRAWIVLGVLAVAVTFFPDWFTDPLAEIGNPLLTPDRVAPPWYFLFLEETLKFFSSVYPGMGFGIYVLFPLLILLMPWVDRNPERGILLRPVALSLGVALAVVFVYFTLIGTDNSRYGQRIVIPDRPLSPAEFRGAWVYAEKNCAYCHQSFGKEGRREGPDLSVIVERRRPPEWIRRFTLNARLYQPGTTMPRYDLPLEDLEALSHYLLSLDARKDRFKGVDRQEFFEYGEFLYLERGKPQEGKK